jgi:hypothetical protein
MRRSPDPPLVRPDRRAISARPGTPAGGKARSKRSRTALTAAREPLFPEAGDLASQSEIVSRYGCPYDSLCSELDKRPGGTDFALGELMRVPIEWAEQQFPTLGRRDARDLAMSLLASYQGSALLANTLRDPGILTREARRLTRWTDKL